MVEDLREYTKDELSLRVFNDEVLYNLRDSLKELFIKLKENFLYTREQVSVLLYDIFEDNEGV